MLTAFVISSWLILSVGISAAQDLPCPAMPDKITQVNRDVRSDVNASVGSLGKLKAGEVGVKTDVVAKNLFDKYPNTDRIIVVQMMAATYCSLLRDSKTVRDSEKLRLWAEFSERVFKFENPNYNPTPQQAPKPKRRATPEHKGSPVPTNSRGSANNGTETELHGGQKEPPSGLSDTFKTDATVATEVRRAKPTIEFEFPTTGDRKQKFHVHGVRPNFIKIEPKPTAVNEDDLPTDVSVVSGTVTILKFGQEDEGGYVMLDTSQVLKGTRIRGEIIGYTEVTPPNEPPSRSIQQNNSGGTNVQQATTGDNSPIIDSPVIIASAIPFRTLTVDQKRGIAAFVKTLPQSVLVSVGGVYGSADAVSYAGEFVPLFDGRHLDNQTIPAIRTGFPITFTNVFVASPSDSDPACKYRDAFVGALIQLGIQARPANGSKVPPGNLELLIGFRPEEVSKAK